ncbi:ribonuclease [Halolactibacillus halophilus]|uniref:Ribonuclease n=1 Tax=Halolactibacillus halophilus TaxID=306540 RepID=A0A1I5NIR8_9BACI|nr:ribonuclease domain-containing protein [Halolactibacillus halophilus]GEM01339.1 hypothetical protein HHA03_08710 [Halolactibacillus halophilus]SFP21226.1 ribonuclease [Halolactibacillus halophilus]
MNKLSRFILVLFVTLGVAIFSGEDILDLFLEPNDQTVDHSNIEETGHYTTVDEVSAYITHYQALPSNYLTKDEAYDLGWEPDEGNLHDVAPGMSIGGDPFYNREGRLPNATYYEADIDYTGDYRNEKRLVYSNEGTIYYTDNHYESFREIDMGEAK